MKDKPHPRGEICVRTATMIEGYVGVDSPDANKAFIRDGPLAGFFATGDVGELIKGSRGRGRKRRAPRLRVVCVRVCVCVRARARARVCV